MIKLPLICKRLKAVTDELLEQRRRVPYAAMVASGHGLGYKWMLLREEGFQVRY